MHFPHTRPQTTAAAAELGIDAGLQLFIKRLWFALLVSSTGNFQTMKVTRAHLKAGKCEDAFFFKFSEREEEE